MVRILELLVAGALLLLCLDLQGLTNEAKGASDTVIVCARFIVMSGITLALGIATYRTSVLQKRIEAIEGGLRKGLKW